MKGKPPSLRLSLVVVILMAIIAGSLSVPSGVEAATYCFKYQMTVRAEPDLTSAAVKRWSGYQIRSSVVKNGWIKVSGGYVKLGPPNQTQCNKTSSSSAPKTEKSFGAVGGIVSGAVKDALQKRQRQLEQKRRDMATSRAALAQIDAAIFCNDVNGKYGVSWSCGKFDPSRVELNAKLLQNESEAIRNRVRPSVKAFVAFDMRGTLKVRMNQMLNGAVTGLPANSWKSRKVTRMRARAAALISGNNTDRWRLFLKDAQPNLAIAAKALKAQHPMLMAQSKKFLAFMGECSATQEGNGFARNAAICFRPPAVTFQKRINALEVQLPMPDAQFVATRKSIPPYAHKVVGAALRKQAQMNKQQYAKARGLTPYLKTELAFSTKINKAAADGIDPNTIPHPCAAKPKGKQAECRLIVNSLRAYPVVFVPAMQAALAAYDQCEVPRNYDQFVACYQSFDNNGYRAKVNELNAQFNQPPAPQGSRLQLLQPWILGSIGGTALLIFAAPFFRRSKQPLGTPAPPNERM